MYINQHLPRAMRLSVINCLLFAASALIAGCSLSPDGSGDKPDIIVSIEPQRAILEEIGGDRVEVTTLLSGGSDPETFDPTMASMMRLERADAWMQIGNISFEEALSDRMGGRGPMTVDTSMGVELLGGHDCDDHHDHHDDGDDEHHGHDRGHHHGGVDPHTWSSVVNLKIMASNMLEVLIGLSPADSAYFASRYERLTTRLDSIDADFRTRLAPVRGKAFMVWHPSLSYFARDYGLEQTSISADHSEPSILELRDVIAGAVRQGINVFISQRSFDPRISATVSGHIGARTTTFDPLDYNWEAELDSVVSILSGVN